MASPANNISASRKILNYLSPFSYFSSSSSSKSDRLFQLASDAKPSSRFAWTLTIRVNKRTVLNSIKWTLICSASVVASYYLFRFILRQLNGKASHPGYGIIHATDALNFPPVDPLEMAVNQMQHAGHPTLRYERNDNNIVPSLDDADDVRKLDKTDRPTDDAIERIDAALSDKNSHSKLVKGDESLNPSSSMPTIPDVNRKPSIVPSSVDGNHVMPALPAKLEQLLHSPHVAIKFPQRVRIVIESMIADGADKLQVIADFDRTLTRAHKDGKPCATTHSVIDSTSLLPKWFHQQCLGLRDFYYAKEIDETLSDQVKSEFMLEWWTKAHELLLKAGLTHGMIEQMVAESNAHLRDNSQTFFNVLNQYDVPLLIFSAGIGTIIREILRQINAWDERHMAVVSNELVFATEKDAQGELPLIGFKAEQVIHSFNKEKIFDEYKPYFDAKRDRVNVILMGDMMGDLKMAQGVHNVQNILTIGFLNDKFIRYNWYPKPSYTLEVVVLLFPCWVRFDRIVFRMHQPKQVETRLEAYMNGYDIVLKDDQTMTFPIRLAEAILKSSGSISSPSTVQKAPPLPADNNHLD